MKNLKSIYKTLFKGSVQKASKQTLFLETFPLPILKEKEILLYEEYLNEKRTL